MMPPSACAIIASSAPYRALRNPADPARSSRFVITLQRALDPVTLLLAGAATVLRDPHDLRTDAGFSLLVAALLLPFVLDGTGAYAPRPAGRSSRWRAAALGVALVFGGVVGAALLTGEAGPSLRAGGLLWFLGTLAGCIATRALVSIARHRIAGFRCLQPRTVLVSVGIPDPRLVDHLALTTRLMGRFDARTGALRRALTSLDGTLDDVVALGQRRPLDCVIVALPPHADVQLASIIHRLKCLAVDVAIAPQLPASAPDDWDVDAGFQRLAA